MEEASREQKLARWFRFRLARRSFRRDYREDDRGLDAGALVSAALTIGMIAAGLIIATMASGG